MANGDLSDLSGWTFKEVAPGTTPPAKQSTQQADITKHDPQTYAGLTTDAAIADLHSRGLMPDIGTARDIYTKAMEESQQHWQHEAEAAQAKRLELQTRVAAVTPGQTETGATAPSLLQTEEAQRQAVTQQFQQQQKEWEQGPRAAAIAAAQPGGIGAGQIQALPADDMAKLDMFRN